MLQLKGQRFGRLEVLCIAGRTRAGKVTWECQCDCGKTVEVVGSKMVSGHTQSCGCYQRDRTSECAPGGVVTHGKSKTPAYQVWADMKSRCGNQNHRAYGLYGGRGITVCERWSEFEAFHEDMGDPPHGLTLERLDNEMGYSPENCVWASRLRQARNTRAVKSVVYQGKRLFMQDVANMLGRPRRTVHRIYSRGGEVAIVGLLNGSGT